jgi:putative phage-type endonuclease
MGSTPIGISGSRAAAVLGMSPWATSLQVWQDIMEARTPGFNEAQKYDYEKFEGNVATRWGLAFEDAIIKLAESKIGTVIEDREMSFSHNDLPYVTCHIDGNFKFRSIPDVIHEGKTTTMFAYNEKWGDPGTDRIPIEYQIQAQHQMLCTGAKECIVSVLVFPRRPEEWENEWIIPHIHLERLMLPDGNMVSTYDWAEMLAQMGYFHQYTIKANPDLHAMMIEAYKAWWQTHVMGVVAPDPQSYADIRAMITAPSGTIVADVEMIRMFKEYNQIGKEIGASGHLAKRRDQLKKMILDSARQMESTLDDESTDKWIFRDDRGGKLGQYGKTARGMMFK